MAADQAAWLDRLDAELSNLRAAIALSLTQADPEPGLRLAASLRDFWQAQGQETRLARYGHLRSSAARHRQMICAQAMRQSMQPPQANIRQGGCGSGSGAVRSR